ncbi:MAG: N-acetylmuramoyl-L-alanine amidase [Oceanospirillaceae bacterium]|nr:N-acetylmuramoyl-L-alanine amidase [Oceanospirillaceae bacterium]
MGKKRSLNDITTIVLHCADTPNGRATSIEDIDRWHGERTPPFKRDLSIDPKHQPHLKHIGYHYVITLDGEIHEGRPLIETGAHVSGHNHDTVGVCLIGRDQFTPKQFHAIQIIKSRIEAQVGIKLPIKGHREFDPNKTCPGFDVQAYVNSGYQPYEHRVLEIKKDSSFNTQQTYVPLKKSENKERPMSVLTTIAGLFKPAADLIDNLHTSTEEEMIQSNNLVALQNELVIAQNQITSQIIQLESDLLKAQSAIIVAEANGQSWMQRNWRPITMLTFLVLVVADTFGLTEFRLSEQAWVLLQIGLGGYVVGRSAEKIMPNVMKAMSK